MGKRGRKQSAFFRLCATYLIRTTKEKNSISYSYRKVHFNLISIFQIECFTNDRDDISLINVLQQNIKASTDRWNTRFYRQKGMIKHWKSNWWKGIVPDEWLTTDFSVLEVVCIRSGQLPLKPTDGLAWGMTATQVGKWLPAVVIIFVIDHFTVVC